MKKSESVAKKYYKGSTVARRSQDTFAEMLDIGCWQLYEVHRHARS
jgi:hypothetical protein